HGDDLAVGKAGLLHGTSSGKGTRKFHFWRLLMRGGITHLQHAGALQNTCNTFGAAVLNSCWRHRTSAGLAKLASRYRWSTQQRKDHTCAGQRCSQRRIQVHLAALVDLARLPH
ncbi:hypothetical protein, partial [Xanthomonas citri]|uniref:hypothetical protein n=1 Tax=Xanthomonas citri TaxID=346 RepID=UPI001A9093A0